MTRAECGVSPSAVWTVVGAGALGLVATYWDDGWHTEIGRDSALIPPHLLLYVSVGLVGVVLAVWLLTTLWRTRSVRAVFATPGLALAVAAGLATAGAAPADAAWHAAFGRDSVLWSPPHLLSVIGTAVLVVAVLLGTAASRPARTALAVLLLGAAEVVVLEYETDVPQFTEALYLPVLLAVALGVAWIVRTLVADSVVVAWTVLGYLVFRLGIFVGFMIGGGSRPTSRSRCSACSCWRPPRHGAVLAGPWPVSRASCSRSWRPPPGSAGWRPGPRWWPRRSSPRCWPWS